MRNRTKVDFEALQKIGRDLLIALGENPDEERLKDTPERFAKAWREFIEYDPGKIDTVFNAGSTDQVIVVSGIKIWSMCEHHLLPFNATVSIGYLAKNRLLGLSKLARIAQFVGHHLQLQERVVEEIGSLVQQIGETEDVAVLACGEHLCMTMRGIKCEALMTSSWMRGIFKEEASARMEFMEIAKGVKP